MKLLCLGALAFTASLAALVAPRTDAAATAEMLDANGRPVGRATFTATPDGVRILAELHGLPPGVHAMHVHTVGKCHPPTFDSAGGHFNPTGKKHGAKNPDGPHAGDLPNFEVAADGTARVEVVTPRLSLGEGPTSLLPSGKTCLVIHEKPDDEFTDPSGNAGGRLACGIIRQK